jgi:hypothetical protein
MSIAVTGTNIAKFTGWRKMFMGTVNEYNASTGAKVPVTIDSTLIRGLNKISEKVNTSAKEFTVPVGATKIIIACPKTHELSKCEYFTMSWETISNFP